MSYLVPKVKDNAVSTLAANVLTSSTNILLVTDGGDNFPQPITAAATSAGSSTTLNSTGISAAGVVVGDIVVNLTDSTPATDTWSAGVVKTVTTNAVTTTPLKGGTDNTWSDTDVFVVNPFVINLTKRTGAVITGAVTQYEKVLITSKTNDTIGMPGVSGYRGFDGTTIAAFDTADFVTIEVDQSFNDGIKNLVTSIVSNPNSMGLVNSLDDQAIFGVKTFADDSARSTTNAAPSDEKSFTNKKYVDGQSSGNSFVNIKFPTGVSLGDVISAARMFTAAEFSAKISIQTFGTASGINKWAMPFVAGGGAISDIFLNIYKVGTPVGDVVIRVETDDGSGRPSGTLVNGNATSSTASSGISTSTTALLNPSFAGSFTPTTGQQLHFVLSTTNSSNSDYYIFKYQYAVVNTINPAFSNTFSRSREFRSGSWTFPTVERLSIFYNNEANAVANPVVYNFNDTVTKNKVYDPSGFVGFAAETVAAGAYGSLLYDGIDSNQTGLTKGVGIYAGSEQLNISSTSVKIINSGFAAAMGELDFEA